MRAKLAMATLACWAGFSSGAATGEVPAAEPAERATGICLALTADLPPGEFLSPGQTEAVPCMGNASALPLVYSRKARAPFATAPIPAGTYLGPLSLAPGEIFAAGKTLRLAYRAGPVAIEREVRLMAPARPGDRALVRAEDGTVLALPFIAAPAGENAR